MRAVLITICLTFVLGASDVRANTYMGSGEQSCGTWINEKSEMTRAARTLWVLGYLSGLNSLSDEDFLENHEAGGILAAIDKYCKENPLKKIRHAADDIAMQMKRMKK